MAETFMTIRVELLGNGLNKLEARVEGDKQVIGNALFQGLIAGLKTGNESYIHLTEILVNVIKSLETYPGIEIKAASEAKPG